MKNKSGLIIFLIFIGLMVSLYLFLPTFLIKTGSYLKCDEPLHKADCILVLAGERGERVTEGVRLYKLGYAPKMLFSGGPAEANYPLAMIMEMQAVKEGVPSEAIILETQSLDTGEDALYCKKIMQNLNWKSAILVTSPYHTRRAAGIFRKVFAGTGITFYVHAVPNSWFKAEEWWKKKQSIKAVVLEYSKTIWYGLFKQSYQVHKQ
jgi:uncharacterized SAM-binding protein YcdF (DUF218 family)